MNEEMSQRFMIRALRGNWGSTAIGRHFRKYNWLIQGLHAPAEVAEWPGPGTIRKESISVKIRIDGY